MGNYIGNCTFIINPFWALIQKFTEGYAVIFIIVFMIMKMRNKCR